MVAFRVQRVAFIVLGNHCWARIPQYISSPPSGIEDPVKPRLALPLSQSSLLKLELRKSQ